MIHTRPCPTCGQVHSVLVVCPTRQEKELLARETFEMAPAAVMGAAGPIGRIDPIGPYGRIALQTARETFGMAPTTCMRCGRALTALDGMHGLCETCDPNSFRNTAKAYDERRARELLAEEIRAAAFWECVVVAVEGSDGNPDELLARIAGLVQEWQVGGEQPSPRCPDSHPPMLGGEPGQCERPAGHDDPHRFVRDGATTEWRVPCDFGSFRRCARERGHGGDHVVEVELRFPATKKGPR